jgi:hypothetical protein
MAVQVKKEAEAHRNPDWVHSNEDACHYSVCIVGSGVAVDAVIGLMKALAVIDRLACKRSESGPAQNPTEIAKTPVTSVQEEVSCLGNVRVDEKEPAYPDIDQ